MPIMLLTKRYTVQFHLASGAIMTMAADTDLPKC